MPTGKGDNNPVEKNTMSVSLNELITALSAAFDLAGSSDRKHSLRTAYIATRLASIMSTAEAEVDNIYYAALLHDLIPPQSYFDQNLIFEILANLPLKVKVADQVAELWQYKRGNGSVDRSDCLSFAARTIYLAECFENLYCNEELEEYRLREMLSSWNSSVVAMVDSNIGVALGKCLQEEAFWQDLRENRINRALDQLAPDWR
ncbi:MAG: HD domain-containing protein, partial [Methanocorpusculum sp.]|nr:HD domain-containing protein [Methanocorpusculum sp.]